MLFSQELSRLVIQEMWADPTPGAVRGRHAPFQSPFTGLGLKVVTMPKSSPRRCSSQRAVSTWPPPTALPDQA